MFLQLLKSKLLKSKAESACLSTIIKIESGVSMFLQLLKSKVESACLSTLIKIAEKYFQNLATHHMNDFDNESH